jgi:hypothetical protein
MTQENITRLIKDKVENIIEGKRSLKNLLSILFNTDYI